MKRKTVAAVVVFFAMAAVVAFLSDWSRVQRAAIGGEVTWVVEPGVRVEEGGALVKIAALSGGEAVAARANARGVVRKAFAVVGTHIKKGDAVAKIERE